MAVLDKRAKQRISTPKQFLVILCYAFALIVLPFTSCQATKKHEEISHKSINTDSSYLVMKSRDVEYLPEIEDVPLPPGFLPAQDKTTIYDTPSGRIVEVYAEGTGDKQDVEKFYVETMPQLGWRKDAGFYKGGIDMKFSKGDEQLRVNMRTNALDMQFKKSEDYEDEYELRLQDNAAKMTLRFSLYPKD